MKTKIGVRIMPRDVLLDSQGRAVEKTLEQNGFAIGRCRVGKFVEIEVEGSREEARLKAKEIAQFVLHNPLIETFEIIDMENR